MCRRIDSHFHPALLQGRSRNATAADAAQSGGPATLCGFQLPRYRRGPPWIDLPAQKRDSCARKPRHQSRKVAFECRQLTKRPIHALQCTAVRTALDVLSQEALSLNISERNMASFRTSSPTGLPCAQLKGGWMLEEEDNLPPWLRTGRGGVRCAAWSLRTRPI